MGVGNVTSEARPLSLESAEAEFPPVSEGEGGEAIQTTVDPTNADPKNASTIPMARGDAWTTVHPRLRLRHPVIERLSDPVRAWARFQLLIKRRRSTRTDPNRTEN